MGRWAVSDHPYRGEPKAAGGGEGPRQVSSSGLPLPHSRQLLLPNRGWFGSYHGAAEPVEVVLRRGGHSVASPHPEAVATVTRCHQAPNPVILAAMRSSKARPSCLALGHAPDRAHGTFYFSFPSWDFIFLHLSLKGMYNFFFF